jgi:peroxiredoxin
MCLLGLALVWVVSGTLEQRVINPTDTAPDFKVVTESGKTITRDNFGGKLLVLNFWASWCPPCVEETPSLNEFAREFKDQGVVVLGVSSDRNEAQYRKFLARFQVPYETSRDPDADISASYGTFQIPETYLIGPNGKVIEKVISNQNWMDPEFIARVRKML